MIKLLRGGGGRRGGAAASLLDFLLLFATANDGDAQAQNHRQSQKFLHYESPCCRCSECQWEFRPPATVASATVAYGTLILPPLPDPLGP